MPRRIIVAHAAAGLHLVAQVGVAIEASRLARLSGMQKPVHGLARAALDI
jgi:hypothetical protein